MLFVVSAEVYGSLKKKNKIFGVFSTIEKAKQAIEIFVERYRPKINEYEDEDDVEFMVERYRENFKINKVSDTDDTSIFSEGDIPNF